MLLYKILRAPEWDALQRNSETAGSPVDLEDGFIHLSNGEQVVETAEKHFAGVDDLLLIALDSQSLGIDLRWEESRGGARFPHLYRALRLEEVLWAKPLVLDGDRHLFPPIEF
ncbi:MAG: DUF952 domain-containing protein [Planctomycetes bacterium]|nr:DUF952 domain-containing protein [Planctomycetota bacterium]